MAMTELEKAITTAFDALKDRLAKDKDYQYLLNYKFLTFKNRAGESWQTVLGDYDITEFWPKGLSAEEVNVLTDTQKINYIKQIFATIIALDMFADKALNTKHVFHGSYRDYILHHSFFRKDINYFGVTLTFEDVEATSQIMLTISSIWDPSSLDKGILDKQCKVYWSGRSPVYLTLKEFNFDKVQELIINRGL